MHPGTLEMILFPGVQTEITKEPTEIARKPSKSSKFFTIPPTLTRPYRKYLQQLSSMLPSFDLQILEKFYYGE